MKKIFLLICCSLVAVINFAQHFPGYGSGSQTGVNSVFANPANTVDSRYRWNVNILSLHTGVANNNASFSLKNLGSSFGNDADSAFFGSSSKSTSGAINLDVRGPSFLIAIDAKNSLAVTTRFRALANIVDMDGQLIRSINSELSPSSLPFVLQSRENQKLILNGWSDWGLSYGRVLSDKGAHFFKGGITVKYLSGATNSFININNLKGTLDGDVTGVYLTNASGAVAIGVSGIDISDDFDAGDAFQFKGSGIGADLGFVYEYRPDGNTYRFRAGIALLDIGSIRYKTNPGQSGSYTINVPSSARWYPSDLNDKSVSEIKSYLDASPYFTSNGGAANSYKASLPTSLQLSFDYAAGKGFYLNLASQLNLIKEKSVYNSFYYSTVMLMPGYEYKKIGVYLPLSYNTISRLNAGLSLHLGPVFIGSGSVLSALVDKSKQADFHFGVQFGGLKARKEKVE